MRQQSSTTSPTPTILPGYHIECELSPGQTWLAMSPNGRPVTLKVLESDCLMGDQLHPMVHDRLGRVRELAHLAVACLFGVERYDDQVYLLWEYIEGTPLEQYLATRTPTESALAAMAHDLVTCVQSLHALGIVHGAIHGRNIIVRPDGTIALTHISPLLYNDPDVDMEALRPLLEQMHYASEFPDMSPGLQSGVLRASGESEAEAAGVRRRALIAAALVALLGGVLALCLWYAATRISADPTGDPQAFVPSRTLEPGMAV
jgi:tRNA A-37 threonylcarbamoyl transferase component Bud32